MLEAKRSYLIHISLFAGRDKGIFIVVQGTCRYIVCKTATYIDHNQ